MARSSLYPPSVDPGFPELPSTPDGWTRTTFGGVLEVVERPLKLDPEATYRLVTAKRNRGGITLRSEMSGREILTKTQFEAKERDFLISRRQIIHGACGLVPSGLDGAVVSNEYSILRTRPNLLMDYLGHYSHSTYFQRTCFHSSHGVDVEKMIFKIEEWLARDVAMPPLAEQRKIAAILSSVDDAIEGTQAVLGQLQVVKKAMMAELLTRGLPGRHKRFKQTEIGEVPEEWEVRALRDACEIAYGLTVNERRRQSADKRPYLTVANAQDDGFDLSAVKDIGLLPGDDERFGVRPGDVLLVEGNANPNRLGRALVWRGEITGALHQNHLIRVRSAQSALAPDWLAAAINGESCRRQIMDHVKTSSGLHTINSTVVGGLSIAVPPLEEQRELVDVLAVVVDRTSAESSTRAALASLKSALMSVLLTGEVRLIPDETAA